MCRREKFFCLFDQRRANNSSSSSLLPPPLIHSLCCYLLAAVESNKHELSASLKREKKKLIAIKIKPAFFRLEFPMCKSS